MRNAAIIFRKQIKDTGKNIALCIQFIMFPAMAAIMETAIKVDNLPPRFFVGMFAVMHVGMAPLNVMSAVISEEKEKNTLRMLLFGNVKPLEYLLGIGGFVFGASMAGAVVFGILGGYRGTQLVRFLLILAAGYCVSMLVGAVIGIRCKSQIAAATIATPIMMVFAFLPMLAMFNGTIARAADFAYSQQIQLLLDALAAGTSVQAKSLGVIGVSLAAAAGLFIHAYRRCGLA